MSYTPEQVMAGLKRQFDATGRVPAFREQYQVDPANRWWEVVNVTAAVNYFFDADRQALGYFGLPLAGEPVPGYEGPYVAGGPVGEYTGPWFPVPAGVVIPEYAQLLIPAIASHTDNRWMYPGYGGSAPEGRTTWFNPDMERRMLENMRRSPAYVERWLALIDPVYLGADVPQPTPEVIHEVAPGPHPPTAESAPSGNDTPPTYPWSQPGGAPVPDAQPPAEPVESAAPVPADQPEPVPTYPWSQPGGAPVPDPQAPQSAQPESVAAPAAADEPSHTWMVVEALYRVLCEGKAIEITVRMP